MASRFSRIIINSTFDDQKSRLDVSQILLELTNLSIVHENPGQFVSSEMVAEEIASRTFEKQYIWDQNKLEARIELANNVIFKIGCREVEKEIVVSITWLFAGMGKFEQRKKMGTYFSNIIDILIAGQWVIVEKNIGGNNELKILGKVSAITASLQMDSVCKSLKKSYIEAIKVQ
ncbi:MAG: hypothetical protein HQL87_11815 [Magnetococcales bacterium]|nr:hypothetical protein [Magnetococcales bacterium]